MLENATPRTRVFEAPGLFEQTIAEGSENSTVNPMRVYIAPGERVHIRVSAERLNREALDATRPLNPAQERPGVVQVLVQRLRRRGCGG